MISSKQTKKAGMLTEVKERDPGNRIFRKFLILNKALLKPQQSFSGPQRQTLPGYSSVPLVVKYPCHGGNQEKNHQQVPPEASFPQVSG